MLKNHKESSRPMNASLDRGPPDVSQVFGGKCLRRPAWDQETQGLACAMLQCQLHPMGICVSVWIWFEIVYTVDITICILGLYDSRTIILYESCNRHWKLGSTWRFETHHHFLSIMPRPRIFSLLCGKSRSMWFASSSSEGEGCPRNDVDHRGIQYLSRICYEAMRTLPHIASTEHHTCRAPTKGTENWVRPISGSTSDIHWAAWLSALLRRSWLHGMIWYLREVWISPSASCGVIFLDTDLRRSSSLWRCSVHHLLVSQLQEGLFVALLMSVFTQNWGLDKTIVS